MRNFFHTFQKKKKLGFYSTYFETYYKMFLSNQFVLSYLNFRKKIHGIEISKNSNKKN